jgi:hypothetical protein
MDSDSEERRDEIGDQLVREMDRNEFADVFFEKNLVCVDQS